VRKAEVPGILVRDDLHALKSMVGAAVIGVAAGMAHPY
jgi:hypothetical protein